MILRLRGRQCLVLQVLAQHHDSSTTPLDDNPLTLSDFIEDLKPVPARFRRCHSFHMYNVQLIWRRVNNETHWPKRISPNLSPPNTPSKRRTAFTS